MNARFTSLCVVRVICMGMMMKPWNAREVCQLLD